MLEMKKNLLDLHKEGKDLKVCLVGMGKMGRGLVSQLLNIKGMTAKLIISKDINKGLEALEIAGVDPEDILVSFKIDEINQGILSDKYVVTDDSDVIRNLENIDCVVDATGNLESGAKIALDSIETGKNIVMLNVETDATIGPILYEKARKNKLVYTGSKGDEPGAAIELYNFAEGLGFKTLALGKGKNNPIDFHITPDMVREEALRKGLKPEMLAGFIDGTNTMIEMTVMANATGLKPDVRGGHGIKANLDELKERLKLKEEGGLLDSMGIVDYVFGIAPGVFLLFTTDSEELKSQLKYNSMGDGPNYMLYRPYHLTSLETPISIYEACVNGVSSIVPLKGQVADTIARAKKDLKPGDYLDRIGGYTFYGSIEKNHIVRSENLVPVGLIDESTKLVKALEKDQYISYDALEFNKNKLIYRLRMEQDRLQK